MEEKKGFATSTEDIQSKLDKKLGPEYISKRVGFGTSRVAYIEGWKAINLANQIFGYNGWSTEVKNITVDFMDERQGKFCIGCTAIIRVTLTDGTFREDIGYGTVENERRKSSAFERAKKSAVTDALKRSLRAFGNALGNCLYDKAFLAKIDKVKFDPPDFDEGNLYRATDEANENSKLNVADQDSGRPPSKRRNFNGYQNSESRTIPGGFEGGNNITTNLQAEQSAPSHSAETGIQPQDADELDDSFMFSDELQDEDLISAGNANGHNSMASVPVAVPEESAQSVTSPPVPATFVTAKAAPNVQNKAPVPPSGIFNPKFKAQSIRHTVDQTTSTHIKASVLRENGLEGNRTAVYQRFAPKGKVIDSNPSLDTPSKDLASNNVTNTAGTTATREGLPSKTISNLNPAVVNTPVQRKPVGMPKGHLPNLRKPV
ncbi:LAFE_0F13872g1_1 [Lachancea fermentati]|uniref:DNA repair and recombination protein RAD52 n=1 Tax=Lachancea fermentati TaxID=4955 RepID=A0A1G4MFW8_LACFM|nr:LAFE_0F13872g1_1 [Lachancea fermentati]